MEGWLTRIATNTCLNLIRGSKRRPELTVSDLSDDESGWLDQQFADTKSSVENDLVAADLADRLLGTLSPEDQQALLMIDGEKMFASVCKVGLEGIVSKRATSIYKSGRLERGSRSKTRSRQPRHAQKTERFKRCLNGVEVIEK